MSTKRVIRREIDIARACFTAGLDRAVEDYDAAVADMLVGRPVSKETANRAWFRERLDGFLARYGTRLRKGAELVPIDAKEVLGYVKAHSEFILDAHARPEDLAEYVKECQDASCESKDDDATPAPEPVAPPAKVPKPKPKRVAAPASVGG